MFKKVLSLIIIFSAVASLVFVFFPSNIFNGLFSQTGNNIENVLECAHGVDRSGSIYYIRRENNQSYLVSVDSLGRQSYKKNISKIVMDNCIFDTIFVDQDKSLYLTVYELVPNTLQIAQAGIYVFRDDGSFVKQIFKYNLQHNYDSKFRLISAMSDDNSNVYFGLINNNKMDIFTYEKGSNELAKKSSEYFIDEITSKVNASYVLPSEEVIFSLEGGTLLKKSKDLGDISYNFSISSKIIIDQFWYAGSQFYCRDAVSGNIYLSSGLTFDLSIATRGSKVISDKEAITFKQLYPIAVGSTGNVMGIYSDGKMNRIFLGGFAFLPEIGKTDTSNRSDLMMWFLLVGVIAGVVVASLLLWDFYCNFLNMKLSILLRQSLLVTMVIFLALYVLTNNIIIPKSKDMIGDLHLNEQIKASQMLIAAFKGFVNNNGTNELDISKSGNFFEQFQKNLSASINTVNEETQNNQEILNIDFNTSHISILVKNSGQYVVAASNDRYEGGFPVALMGYGKSMEEGLEKAEKNVISSYNIMTQSGKELCILLPTGLYYTGFPVILSMTTGLDVLDNNISNMSNNVVIFMRFIGFLLVLLVMVVEYFTVHNVRKLKKDVDKIAEGDYGKIIDINSGDEIEDLSKSIQVLSVNILNVTNSLNKLNASYHRFVPQRFLEILGQTHIENVGKGSQAHKENVVMLFLRFRFLSSMGENSEQIFMNINDVFENVVSTVNNSKGSIFDFLPSGFDAIFETKPEEALRTALRIREALSTLNEKRSRNGLGEVDIRIFISKGNIMLGFIGDEKRMEPTAISNESQKADPVVNLCFDSDIYIACTREVLDELPQSVYRSRRIGEVIINEEKMELFDLYDSDPYTLLKTKEVHAQRFELGVNLFMKGDYANARNMFMDIIKYSSLDGAARNYMYLAEHNLRSENKQSTYTTIHEFERIR